MIAENKTLKRANEELKVGITRIRARKQWLPKAPEGYLSSWLCSSAAPEMATCCLNEVSQHDYFSSVSSVIGMA